jgi:tetratricopeptide (TPR) repeat protein
MSSTKNIFSIFLTAVFIILSSCGRESEKKDTKKTGSEPTSAWDEKISADSTNPDLYNQRAKYFLEKNNPKAALADAQKAFTLDSSKSEYYITLADAYFASNKTRLTKETLERCIKKDPENSNAIMKLAELLLYVKQNKESISYLNMALKLDQYNAKAYFMKGMNFKEIGDTASAISSMETATEQDPNYYAAYMQLGLLNAAKKNPIAVDYYNNALRLQPTSNEALYDKAKFFQDFGDIKNAVETYNQLLKVNPKHKNAQFNLGVINLVLLKEPKEAIKYFTDAISSDDRYVEAYYARGLAFEKIGLKSNAMDDFTTALLINPDYQDARTSLEKYRK